MSFLVNTPPILDGDNTAKITQLYKHLYQMSEQVNYALNALAMGDVVDLTGTTQSRQTFTTAMSGGTIGGTDAPSLQSYNELKSLIIKTGNAIEKSKASIELVLDDEVKRLEGDIGGFQNLIDTVSGKVDGNTEAISGFNNQLKDINKSVSDLSSGVDTKFKNVNTTLSDQDEKIGGVEGGLLQAQTDIETNASDILDNKTEISGLKEVNVELLNAFGVGSEFGSYAEAISNKMSLSADGIVQKYELVSKLQAVDEQAAGFAEWINLTDEYIKTGFLYTDENGAERVGVAIGTNIAASIVDGEIQQNTKTDLLATFVSDSLIFWQGGQKVAYMSNKKLYILSAEFLGSYRIGKFQWVYTEELGLILKFLN